MIFLFANVIEIYRIREKEGKKKRKQGQKGGRDQRKEERKILL